MTTEHSLAVEVMTWVVFVTGVTSLASAGFVGVAFARSRWSLGKALAADKLVESIAAAVTMIFASNALATGTNEVDMWLECFMRLAIFLPAMLVSWHLWYKTKEFNNVRDAAKIGDRVAGEYADKSPVEVLAEVETLFERLKQGSK